MEMLKFLCQELPNMTDYNGRSLHRIPGTIAEILGEDVERDSLPSTVERVEDAENVVVLLIDGLGYRYLEENLDGNDFLSDLVSEGCLECLESVYPSETSAAMTSFYTGLTPSQHGMIGWYMYKQEEEICIHALPFKTMDWSDASEEGLRVDNLIKGDSFTELIANKDVDCHAVLPTDIVDGKVTEYLLQDAEKTGYRGLGDMAVKLRNIIKSTKGKNYIFCYVPLIDSISHHEGTESEEYSAEISQLNHALETQLQKRLDPMDAQDTAVILTADHGFINTDVEENIDLLEIDGVEEALEETGEGEKIMPFGGPRNTHLRIQRDRRNEVKKILEEKLEATIWTKEEALEQGIFGKKYFDSFEDRIGDLIISHESQAIWHGESDELDFIGHHGGLSDQEMEIPMVSAYLENLTN